MALRNPTDWMWAEAYELMAQAERLHRQFFRLSASERTQASWEPPVDMFEDDDEIVVVVALPGVSADRIEVTTEPGALRVRAERVLPAAARGAVRHLEIPYGCFERRIALPEIPLQAGTPDLTHGCLIMTLRKLGGQRP